MTGSHIPDIIKSINKERGIYTMVLSRKEFLGFYNGERELANMHGFTISQGHYEELKAMYKLYKESKTNKEFTQKMTNAGYGKLN